MDNFFSPNQTKPLLIERWHSPRGVALLEKLHAGHFSKHVMDGCIEKPFGHYDLRGIDLTNAQMEGLDLSGIDFFGADFSRANLSKCDFTDSWLSESVIKGADFEWSVLKNTLLDNVQFNRQTNLLGVNLSQANFTLSTLLYDLALSQQRIQQLEQHHKHFALALKWLCDYGRSFTRYALWVVILVMSYACAYFLLDGISFKEPKTFLDCAYFSLVTFATVGYGDILPISAFAKCVVMSEIAIGYLMGGLLIAILSKRVMG